MANMANITVKAANGTTDVIYVAKTPSSGDKTPALWKVDAASTKPIGRPSVSVVADANSGASVRYMTINSYQPVLSTDSSGNAVVTDNPGMSTRVTLPQRVDQTKLDELVAQHANLLTSALMQQMLKEGYAAT